MVEYLEIRQNVTLDGYYSGLRIPQDVLLRRSDKEQIVAGHIKFSGNVTVDGYLNIGYVNNFHTDLLCDMAIQPDEGGTGFYGIEIIGKYGLNSISYICFCFIVIVINRRDHIQHRTNCWHHQRFLTQRFIEQCLVYNGHNYCHHIGCAIAAGRLYWLGDN